MGWGSQCCKHRSLFLLLPLSLTASAWPAWLLQILPDSSLDDILRLHTGDPTITFFKYFKITEEDVESECAIMHWSGAKHLQVCAWRLCGSGCGEGEWPAYPISRLECNGQKSTLLTPLAHSALQLQPRARS